MRVYPIYIPCDVYHICTMYTTHVCRGSMYTHTHTSSKVHMTLHHCAERMAAERKGPSSCYTAALIRTGCSISLHMLGSRPAAICRLTLEDSQMEALQHECSGDRHHAASGCVRLHSVAWTALFFPCGLGWS